MVTMLNREVEKEFYSSSSNDEFEKYLAKQKTRTTFNGTEIATFSWYKRLFGLQ